MFWSVIWQDMEIFRVLVVRKHVHTEIGWLVINMPWRTWQSFHGHTCYLKRGYDRPGQPRAQDFLSFHEYKHLNRWIDQIASRDAVQRGIRVCSRSRLITRRRSGKVAVDKSEIKQKYSYKYKNCILIPTHGTRIPSPTKNTFVG